MKLKKKKITTFIKRVPAPNHMMLGAYVTSFKKLVSKYGAKLKLRYRAYVGGYWLVEDRMETDEELAKRQRKHDLIQASIKKEQMQYKAQEKARRKLHLIRELAQTDLAMKKATELLKLGGFKVSKA